MYINRLFAVKHPEQGVAFWSDDQRECEGFICARREEGLTLVRVKDIKDEFMQFLTQRLETMTTGLA
jgi:hypothetical protein